MGGALVALGVDAYLHADLDPSVRYLDLGTLAILGGGIPLVTWTHWFWLVPPENWGIKRRLVNGPQALTLEFADVPVFSRAWNDGSFFVSIIEWGESSWRLRKGVTLRLWGGLAPYFEIPLEAQRALERALEPWHYERHVYAPNDPTYAMYRRSVHYMHPGQESNSVNISREKPPF